MIERTDQQYENQSYAMVKGKRNPSYNRCKRITILMLFTCVQILLERVVTVSILEVSDVEVEAV